jgi:hypothetical protein
VIKKTLENDEEGKTKKGLWRAKNKEEGLRKRKKGK